jgi:hypothetical protein
MSPLASLYMLSLLVNLGSRKGQTMGLSNMTSVQQTATKKLAGDRDSSTMPAQIKVERFSVVVVDHD